MSLVQIPTNKSTNLDIIKLVQGGEFTDEDAERNKELVSQDAYPWLYNTGNDPNSCLILKSSYDIVDSFTICRKSNIETNTAWKGDGHPNRGAIKTSFGKHGFKLKYPPVALLEDSRIEATGPILIDRRTTDSILVGTFTDGKLNKSDGYGYKNLIADTYGVKDTPNPVTGEPWTEEEIRDEISVFGQAADYQNDDPKGKIDKVSFHGEFVRIYRKKLDSGKYPDIFDDQDKPLYDVVRKRLDRVMGDSGMADAQRYDLCYTIINQFEPEGAVVGWKTCAHAKAWLTGAGRNYKDIKPTYDDKGKLVNKGIKYVVVGSSQFRSAIVRAAEAWNNNQDYKIRVIIQTEILGGYSLTNTYWKRLKFFREYWHNTLNLLSSAYFGDEGPFFRNIVLYGAIPAYKPIHDLDKLLVPINGNPDNSEPLDEDFSDDDITTHEESKRWKQK
jgi:hypothetical protein